MSVVHQVLAGAAPRDAITNHALETQEVLRAVGIRGEVFADERHIDGSLRGKIRAHSQWSRWAKDGDPLVLHYSIDSPAFHELLPRCGAVGMQYHNITPPELLWRYSPALARQCNDGRRKLADLAQQVDLAAADSEFNGGELTDLGFAKPSVVGILRDGSRHIQPHKRLPGDVRLLFVGRGVANKAQDELILVLASLRQAGVNATLRLAGAWGPGTAFEARCRWLARRLGIESDVAFLGSISDAELASEYGAATAFVSMSRHEGYFVPAIEAMEAGLPIVARAAGAVPETIGQAGLLIPDATPSLVAEAIPMALAMETEGAFTAARAHQLAWHGRAATTGRVIAFARELAA